MDGTRRRTELSTLLSDVRTGGATDESAIFTDEPSDADVHVGDFGVEGVDADVPCTMLRTERETECFSFLIGSRRSAW